LTVEIPVNDEPRLVVVGFIITAFIVGGPLRAGGHSREFPEQSKIAKIIAGMIAESETPTVRLEWCESRKKTPNVVTHPIRKRRPRHLAERVGIDGVDRFGLASLGELGDRPGECGVLVVVIQESEEECGHGWPPVLVGKP
jgi:hypothetical protein